MPPVKDPPWSSLSPQEPDRSVPSGPMPSSNAPDARTTPGPLNRGGVAPAVEIAGVGLVTPLGVGAWPTFRALMEGRRVSDPAAGLAPPPATPPERFVRGVGSVPSVQHAATDPVVELAERAAREAVADAGLDTAWGLPLFLGCSKGATSTLLRRPEVLAAGPHGFVAAELTRRMSVEPRGAYVAACASGLAALDAAARAVRGGRCRAALVVSAESSLSELFIASYQRLGVLAPLTPTGYEQRPLHPDRCGFILSEQGAAVLLRAADPGRVAPGTPRLIYTGTANEAHDLVRCDPDLPAVRHLIADATADTHPDALAVHPHAPGTADHDPAERAALAAAGLDRRIYANKGALGHGLGASGLASLVVASLCHRTRRLPPMTWLNEPPRELPVGTAHLVLAAGFGGHAAAALIR